MLDGFDLMLSETSRSIRSDSWRRSLLGTVASLNAAQSIATPRALSTTPAPKTPYGTTIRPAPETYEDYLTLCLVSSVS